MSTKFDAKNDALTIRYIELLSLSNKLRSDIEIAYKNSSDFVQWLTKGIKDDLVNFINDNSFTVFDVSYIEYDTRNINTRDDDVIPVIYMNVDGGENKGLDVRVKYGRNPENQSKLFDFTENVGNMVTGFIDNIFRIKNNMSYVIVNLGDNSTIELGTHVGGRTNDRNDLLFVYSIYGGKGTTVTLNDNVTVLGEIYCDNLIVNGNAQIIYSNSSGSQIAKQKIADNWTAVGYNR